MVAEIQQRVQRRGHRRSGGGCHGPDARPAEVQAHPPAVDQPHATRRAGEENGSLIRQVQSNPSIKTRDRAGIVRWRHCDAFQRDNQLGCHPDGTVSAASDDFALLIALATVAMGAIVKRLEQLSRRRYVTKRRLIAALGLVVGLGSWPPVPGPHPSGWGERFCTVRDRGSRQ